MSWRALGIIKVRYDRGLNLTRAGGGCESGWILDVLKEEYRIC